MGVELKGRGMLHVLYTRHTGLFLRLTEERVPESDRHGLGLRVCFSLATLSIVCIRVVLYTQLSKAASPNSRPIPDSLKPPNGIWWWRVLLRNVSVWSTFDQVSVHLRRTKS